MILKMVKKLHHGLIGYFMMIKIVIGLILDNIKLICKLCFLIIDQFICNVKY